jgi:uncharacterized protein YbjT (DUF2867 family)
MQTIGSDRSGFLPALPYNCKMTPAADALTARPRIAIAGATGFIGRALIEALASSCDLVALTRAANASSPEHAGASLEWRSCDLFSLSDSEHALAGVDAAFYLVHSMMPSARLTQGTFADMDLLCADNFARAARSNGVRHIVYLGGLLPPAAESSDLSQHLESRLEVERTLGAYGVPVTTLRAGMVVGAGGSSFEMMTRLVGRLPFMVGPRWMRSLSQAVALEDVVTLLRFALDHPELAGEAYDVGCPDVLSYADMLRLTGDVLGRHTRVLTLPVRTARLSLLWVSVITGASRELVRPLLDSLRHDLVARDGLRLQHLAGLSTVPLRTSIERALAATKAAARGIARKKTGARAPRADSRVRSVQRLPLPAGCDARWVATEYSRWLPQFMAPFLRVDIDDHKSCTFRFWPLPWPLLVLTFAAERSTSDRQLFFVTGGFLARHVETTGPGSSARLEFRSVLGGRFVLAAIHDFVPRLPWLLYTATQALVHLLVMRRFARHLARVSGQGHGDAVPGLSR